MVLSQSVNLEKRCDLEAFKEDCDAGLMTFAEIEVAHFGVLVKYPRVLNEYFRKHQPIAMPKELHALREWQAKLYKELSQPADSRTIAFFVA